MNVCPQCKQKTDGEQCGSCKLVFAEYERQKREQTAQIYKLISAGELDQAKQLAQTLIREFPDSKGDFALLISNINRDLNIAGKYRHAQGLLDRGEHADAILLLRNLKAFDPGLAEKIIALRRRAERHSSQSSKFELAAELFEQKRYGEAKRLLLQISSDSRRKEEVGKLLGRIDGIEKGRLREIATCLAQQLFAAARGKLAGLIAVFPEAEQEQAQLFALLEKRQEISARLTAAAHKAKEERRFLEAKALYAFLVWQDPELRPVLLPHLEEVGGQAVVSLADCAPDLADLGLGIMEDGLFMQIPTEEELTSSTRIGEHLPKIVPVLPVPASLPDVPDEATDIDGDEVADFA